MSPLSLELPSTNTVFSLLNSTEHTKINLGRNKAYLLNKRFTLSFYSRDVPSKLDILTCSLSEAHTGKNILWPFIAFDVDFKDFLKLDSQSYEVTQLLPILGFHIAFI